MSFLPTPRAWARIDLSALGSNLERAAALHPHSRVVAVIKANAYGHGVAGIADFMRQARGTAEVLAVATIDEVMALLQPDTGKRLLLLGGFRTAAELGFLIGHGVEFVIHAPQQIVLLKAFLRDNPHCRFAVWLKLDTGMHRLGLAPEEFPEALAYLGSCPQMRRLVLMSHLACVDATDSRSAAITALQVQRFRDMVEFARAGGDERIESSLSASAAILARPDLNFDYIRPGIMLYGGSPFADRQAQQLGLLPVMTLNAGIIAIRELRKGESIGYGATYTCNQDSRIGVVSIGYADGYPRSAVNGTPVLVQGRDGPQRAGLAGRVSMDMITIDLTGNDHAQVGDPVVLWGNGLPVDEIAACAGTIAYDLCCRVTRRVMFQYD